MLLYFLRLTENHGSARGERGNFFWSEYHLRSAHGQYTGQVSTPNVSKSSLQMLEWVIKAAPTIVLLENVRL
jgi:hypothetical protein